MNKIAALITANTINEYIRKEKAATLRSLNLIDQYVKDNASKEDIISAYNSVVSRFNIFAAKLNDLISSAYMK